MVYGQDALGLIDLEALPGSNKDNRETIKALIDKLEDNNNLFSFTPYL
jgi:hypothetical protein